MQIIRDVREIAIFEGKRYYRYPESLKDSHRKYFQRPGKSLHVAVWESVNGPVPKGHEIHHRDHDTLNNDVSNLECVPQPEHRRESANSRVDHQFACSECGTEFTAKSTQPSSDKHFCSKRCKQRFYLRTRRVARLCEVCGKEFMANKYKVGTCCSLACAGRKGAKRWERAPARPSV